MLSRKIKPALISALALSTIWLVSLPALSFENLGRVEIEKSIQQIQPTAKELRFDEIGWASGIREAERIAKLTNRPVFLFSNVGDMDIGRC